MTAPDRETDFQFGRKADNKSRLEMDNFRLPLKKLYREVHTVHFPDNLIGQVTA